MNNQLPRLSRNGSGRSSATVSRSSASRDNRGLEEVTGNVVHACADAVRRLRWFVENTCALRSITSVCRNQLRLQVELVLLHQSCPAGVCEERTCRNYP